MALVILAAVLLVRYIEPQAVELLRMRSFDLMQELFPRQAADSPVAIVDIDDASLSAIGQWPWPRTTVAQLVDRLTELGALVIGFDVMFAEPDRTSPGRLAESYAGLDDVTREALERLPSNDAVLAASLARNEKVVLGATAKESADVDRSDAEAIKSPTSIRRSSPLPFLQSYPGVVRAIPKLDEAAAGEGMVTIKPEPDGIVRRVPLVVAIGHTIFRTLAFDMLRVATTYSVAVDTDAASGIDAVLVTTPNGDQAAIPTDREGRVWVRFAPHETSLYVSAKDILAGTVDPSRIAGRFVLVGTSAKGLLDNKTTPLDAALPGVEVHAQLLETILGGSYLFNPDWADGAEIWLIGFIGLLMIVLVPLAGARWTLLILVLVSAGVAFGTGYLYVAHSVMLDGSLALVTAVLLYITLVYASYRDEETRRRQIRSAFAHYLAPAMVERLAADPSALRLGGELRNMTILFSDIRGFTAISERFRDDPTGLTRLINRYMTPMTDIIQETHRGTIDKYIGDAIMAFWNAPLDDPEHARNACKGALGMLAELERLNAALLAEAEAGATMEQAAAAGNGGTLAKPRVWIRRLDIGIGINTGDCFVGNMGSDQHFGYTVLGDVVNLASRLEGQSKNYGVAIVIGEDTERHVGDFATLELDLIAVKGRSAPVHIFTLLGGPEAAAGVAYQALRPLHDAFLEAYRARGWRQARHLMAQCRPLEARLDRLYDLYEERIDSFEMEPPPPDWGGVFVAETK